MDDFGKRLKALRVSRNLSQREVGDVIGVVSSSVGKYETVNNSFPSVEILIKLSDFFGVSLDYLLKGTENIPSVENNVSGLLSNSPVIQANHGATIISGDNKNLSPEAAELLRIFGSLAVRERLKLLNYAISLEDEGEAEK